jgi:hypothetical protein
VFVTLLDGKGMVVLSEYIRAEHIATMEEGFSSSEGENENVLGW